MRPIDADELKKQFCMDCGLKLINDTGQCDEICLFVNAVDDAPTIDVQPETQWISVDDALPPECENILVVNSKRITLAYYDNIFIGIQGKSHTLKTVTHWMTLPKTPIMKGGENETDKR